MVVFAYRRPDKSRMHCVSRMSKTHWKGGERIIEKGSVGTSLFLLESGLALAISNGTVVEELAEVCVAVCCSVLQCVAACCSVLQRGAVSCSCHFERDCF